MRSSLRSATKTWSIAGLRATAKRGAEAVREVASRSEEAAGRIDVQAPAASATDLSVALLARDHQLAGAVEQLVEQVRALSHATTLLERERSKYVDLFMHAREALFDTDLAGVIEGANEAASALFGAHPESMVGRGLITFVARQDTRHFRHFLRDLVSSGPLGSRPFTVRMRPRGRAVFIASGHAVLVPGPASTPIAVRWRVCPADAHDVPRATPVGDGELVRSLEHELGEPLMAIAGWARRLRERGPGGDEEYALAVRGIERSATLAESVLADLAELRAVVEEPPEGRAPRAVHLGELVSSVVSAVHDDGRRTRAIRLDMPGAGPELLVRADAKGLVRALEVLIHRCTDGIAEDGPPVAIRVAGGSAVTVVIESPPDVPVPVQRRIRVATAARLIEREGGSLILRENTPSCRVELPPMERDTVRS